MSANKENQQSQTNLTTTIERVIPKFCTSVNVGVLKNNLVMTLAYSEDTGNSTLIERVVIDLDHAKALHEVLSRIIKELS